MLYTYPINPGNSRLFPGLAAEADNYEKYRFKKLRIRYVPSPTGGTTAGGELGQYFDYDPVDAPVTSMTNLKQNESSVVSSVWVPNQINLIPGEDASKWYYVNNGYTNNAAAADRQQNQAIWYAACDRVPSNTSLGAFELEYVVEFRSRKAPAPLVMVASVSSPTLATTGGANTYDVPSTFKQNRGFVPAQATYNNHDDSGAQTRAQNDTNFYGINAQAGQQVQFTFNGNVTVDNTAPWVLFQWNRAQNQPGLPVYTTNTLASGTGTGGSQAISSTFNTTLPAQTDSVGLALSVTTGSAPTLLVVSGTWSIAAITANEVGVRQEEKSLDPVVFTLPEQLPALQTWLSSLPACDIVCKALPSLPKNTIESVQAELDAIARTLRVSRLDIDKRASKTIDGFVRV